MRPSHWLVVLIAGPTLAGCGGKGDSVPQASHNGVITELPGKKGYFEIRARGNSDSAGGRTSRTRKPAENTIVVYFYGPDGTTEMSPAPSDVKIKVGAGDSSKVIPLSDRPQGGFASAPGPFPSAFRGTLTATIDGQPIEANFMIR
jgi:hypothetical protein